MATMTWEDMRGEIIDSREIIARLEELESAAAEEPSDLGCAACGEESMPDGEIRALGPECADELRTLRKFAEQGENFADWVYGETFIPDSEFEDYARQLADDIGAIDANASWPLEFIDWGRAADALKQDYSDIEIDGVTYWGRA